MAACMRGGALGVRTRPVGDVAALTAVAGADPSTEARKLPPCETWRDMGRYGEIWGADPRTEARKLPPCAHAAGHARLSSRGGLMPVAACMH